MTKYVEATYAKIAQAYTDYIFATQDVKAISAEVLNTEFSDHLPVRAYVEFEQ